MHREDVAERVPEGGTTRWKSGFKDQPVVVGVVVRVVHPVDDKPEAVKPVAFDDFTQTENMLTVKLPAKSVVALEIGG